jgi:hypothetical protein
MDRDELKALVEGAREDETFPGYFLYCQVGISGVRSSFGWVDSDGFLRTRADLADDYEAELDYTGAAAGASGLLGAATAMLDAAGFDEGVDSYIARLEAQGVLIPLYYAD